MLAAPLVGCRRAAPPEFRFNNVEWLKQEKLTLDDGESFPPEYRQQVGDVVTALFGTPENAAVPEIVAGDEAVSAAFPAESIRWAAGPVKSDRDGRPISGLYREHCAHCHGITGDGAGPTAAFLNPYPRDFRLGKFKFKSTPLRQAPTDEDLVNVLRNGIPGTAMPSFRALPADEIKSLIDYVKYLSVRGEYERSLIMEVGGLDDEPLIDWSAAQADEDSEAAEEYGDRMFELFYESLYENVLSRWFDPDSKISSVPTPPSSLNPDDAGHADLVDAGRVLFYKKGNCAQCHGETGSGDGQTENFDDWTNDWIKTPGVDPWDRETYRDFRSAGVMPPRAVRPRNLRVGVYRGGGHADDLYRRIANGIEGTPMPAGAVLTPDEVWALVAFVRALPFEESKSGP